MNTQQLINACLGKPGAYFDCPFGPDPVCVRIGKRIFAEIFLNRPWVTLKCEPLYGQVLRARYPDTVRRGYHCPALQQPYNNTVTLDGTVPEDELLAMVNHSYHYALQRQTKAEQKDALAHENPDSSATRG